MDESEVYIFASLIFFSGPHKTRPPTEAMKKKSFFFVWWCGQRGYFFFKTDFGPSPMFMVSKSGFIRDVFFFEGGFFFQLRHTDSDTDTFVFFFFNGKSHELIVLIISKSSQIHQDISGEGVFRDG